MTITNNTAPWSLLDLPELPGEIRGKAISVEFLDWDRAKVEIRTPLKNILHEVDFSETPGHLALYLNVFGKVAPIAQPKDREPSWPKAVPVHDAQIVLLRLDPLGNVVSVRPEDPQRLRQLWAQVSALAGSEAA